MALYLIETFPCDNCPRSRHMALESDGEHGNYQPQPIEANQAKQNLATSGLQRHVQHEDEDGELG